MPLNINEINEIVQENNKPFLKVKEEIGKVIVGQTRLLDRLLIALLTDGHLLVEGYPGIAKTLTITTLSKVLNCGFQRIQFTPDLLPADLIGTMIYNPHEGIFTVRKGPLFTNIVLADEINRAPPKIQSALLEVMQERQITIGAETFITERPFLVLATQNPIEHEGTYPLPEAQTDRFIMKVSLNYPSRAEEKEIISRMSRIGEIPAVDSIVQASDITNARKILNDIYVDDKITEYILDIIFASRSPNDYGVAIEGLLDFGASPRASLMLTICAKAHAFLNGRGYVIPHDVKAIGPDVLRHRIRLSYEAEAEELTAEMIIAKIFDTLPVP
ncbi:MAG: AAA family ATPase [Chlamydiota bacterium]